MPYSPRNIRIACDHAGLTHYGGVYFFHEFLRVLQIRHFLATHLTYPRRNSRYHLSQVCRVSQILRRYAVSYAMPQKFSGGSCTA